MICRWLRWVSVAGLAALMLLGASARPAAAHAVPVLSDPLPNSIMDEAPAELSIRFNEPVVADLSHINVLTQAGQALSVGDLSAVDAAERTLVVALPPLADGAYLVSWQVLSAVDGHTTSGTFSFGVGVAELTAVPEDVTITAQLSPLSAAARWLLLTGTVLLLGLFAFRLFIMNPMLAHQELEREEEQLDLTHARISLRLGAAALGLTFASLLLIFIDQANSYKLLQLGNFLTWLSTRFGSMWLARFICAGAIGALVTNLFGRHGNRQELRNWKWVVGLLLSVGLAATSSLVSHSAALPGDTLQALLIDLAHILAAAVWVGGLIYLAVALWQARQLPPESRAWFHLSLILNFSVMAAMAVGILLLSGGYLAWQHVGSWTALVGTAYGQMLLAKVGLALLPFGIAAINLLIVKPRLSAAYDRPEAAGSAQIMRWFNWLARTEALFALLILLAAGILTDLQRGADAPLLSDAAGMTVLGQTVDDLDVSLRIEPALVGQNDFDVYLSDANGNPVADAAAVSLRFTFLGQSIGADEGEAVSSGDGHYRLEGSYISLIGTWQVEVAIRRPGAFDTFAPYRLEAGLGGNIRPLKSGARPLERFAKFMTLASAGVTGVFLVLFAIGWGFLSARAARNEWQLAPLLLISLFTFWLGVNQLLDFFGKEFTPAKFITNPVLPDVESVAQGERLYGEHCVACHGPEGRGDGPNALMLPSPPADFSAGHTATHPDGDLYYWIRKGIADTAMPAFGDQLTKTEVWHLVNYVRRLGAQAAQPQG